MKEDIKAEWVKRLREERYTPGKGLLRYVNPNGSEEYCPLGVLAEIAVEQGAITRKRDENIYVYDGLPATLPVSVREWAGLNSVSPRVNGTEIWQLNDFDAVTHPQMADLIERYL